MQPAAKPATVIKSRKKILTYDDYAALTPPDGSNYELHNGKLIFMPSHSIESNVLTGFKISVKDILNV